MILDITRVGIAVLLAMTMAMGATAPAFCAPNKYAATQASFPWEGQELPLPLEGIDGGEGQFRNEQWQIMARDLRVRAMRVYDWPMAYNKAGLP